MHRRPPTAIVLALWSALAFGGALAVWTILGAPKEITGTGAAASVLIAVAGLHVCYGNDIWPTLARDARRRRSPGNMRRRH